MGQSRVAVSRHGRAGLGAALCVPVLAVLTLLVLGVEPRIPVVDRLSSRQGSLVVLTLFALVPVALAINLGPALRRAPSNVAVAMLAVVTIGIVVGLIVEDQYPCWVGVPNCD